MLKDSIFNFDVKTNYTVIIECDPPVRDPKIWRLVTDARRSEYGVIHDTSGIKPWNGNAALGEYYHRYETDFKEAVL